MGLKFLENLVDICELEPKSAAEQEALGRDNTQLIHRMAEKLSFRASFPVLLRLLYLLG